MVTLWSIVAIASFLLEWVIAGELIVIWFCGGALVSLVLAFFQIQVEVQIFAFLVVSVILMLVLRPLAVIYLRGNVVPTNYDRLIGTKAQVTKRITPLAWGEVQVPGAVWSAVEQDQETVEVDEIVKIVAIEGAKLIVKKIK